MMADMEKAKQGNTNQCIIGDSVFVINVFTLMKSPSPTETPY